MNGGYGPWSDFTQCTKTCGAGTQRRNRTCDQPIPRHGGRNCSDLGNETEVRSCNEIACSGKTYML